MTMKKLNDEIKQYICDCIRSGCSFREVAGWTGATFAEIHRALTDENEAEDDDDNEKQEEIEMAKGVKISEEKENEIIRCLKAGSTHKFTALSCDVGMTTVNRIARKMREEKWAAGKENKPCAAADNEVCASTIIPENGADVKTFDENFTENGYGDREAETRDLLAELVRRRLLRLQARALDLQQEISKCGHEQELLQEYLRGQR